MKKKILSIVLTLSMLCAFMPVITIAETGTKYDDYLYYQINDDNTGVTITDCDTSATEIVIPNEIEGLPVTNIGDYAFYGCSSLTSVTIPDSVTSIGYGAFYECSGLTGVYITDLASWCNIKFDSYPSNPLVYAQNLYINGELATDITIPNNVTSIGDWAFNGYSGLTSVTIPDSVTSIGYGAFNGCSSLDSVYISDIKTYLSIDYDITPIEPSADECVQYSSNPMYFADKLYIDNKRVTSIEIPNGVTQIPAFAFGSCDSLKSITIPNSVTNIGYAAFVNCSSLASVIIPDSVTNIEPCAFYGCSDISSIKLSNEITNIKYGTFMNCEKLTEINIPDKVTDISGGYTHVPAVIGFSQTYLGAFRGCINLKDIIFSDNIKVIGNYAFWGCKSLTDINIPNSVTSIGSRAFNESGLIEITIPETITYIDYAAFQNCSNLVKINFNAINCDMPISNYGSYGSYFRYCDNFTTVNIGNNVTKIPAYIFKECNNLLSVTIPDNVTYLGEKAFEDCSYLIFASIGNGISSINSDTFSNCTVLKKVFIPRNVTEIEKGAFQNCSLLTTVEYEGSKEEWSDIYIGSGNENLTNAKINYNSSDRNMTITDLDLLYYTKNDNNTITITDGHKLATSINIPDKIDNLPVTEIGYGAFDDCSKLTTLTIPNSIKSIDIGFRGCHSLTDVYYTGTKTQWNAIDIGWANFDLINANIHYNGVAPTPKPTPTPTPKPTPKPTPIPTTTAEITKSETDTTYNFDVSPEAAYANCYVYAAVYDESGVLLAVNRVPLEMTGNTSVSVNKSANDALAKVFIWADTLQPIITAEEFPLT